MKLVRYQKSLKIYLSFGHHHCKEDVEKVKREFEKIKLKPSVYVAENVGTLREYGDEASEAILMNQEIAQARTSPDAKKRYLRDLMHANRKNLMCGFLIAQREMIIDTPGLIYLYAEKYTQEEVIAMLERRNARIKQMKESASRILPLIYERQIPIALEKTELILNAFLRETGMRDRRIASGFESIPYVVKKIHPDQEQTLPISVFGRFGTSHIGVIRRLRESGFDVTTRPFEEIGNSAHIFDKLTRDTSEHLTDDDRITYFFEMVCLGLAHQARSADITERIDAARKKIGGNDGFLKMLDDVPREGSLEKFKDKLRENLDLDATFWEAIKYTLRK